MTTTTLKKRIIQKLDSQNNEALLKAIFTILEESGEEASFNLTPVQKKDLDKRWKEYKSGKSKVYTATEVTKTLRNKLKAVHV
jgi:putative addiction module component (TIGR02574 family)